VITAKNYAAQAERGIIYFSDKCKKCGSIVDHKRAAWISSCIGKSVHFALPDNAEIFDDDLKGIKETDIRLPYKLITLEYFVDAVADEKYNKSNGFDTSSFMYMAKRLVVAMELNRVEFELMFNSDKNIVEVLNKSMADFFIVVFWAGYAGNMWVPGVCGAAIPCDTLKSKPSFVFDKIINGKQFFKTTSKTKYSAYPLVLFPESYGEIVGQYGKHEALNLCMHDTGLEVSALLEFIEALSCKNVSTDTLHKADESTNRKRARSKKLPIYETKCLVIDAGKITTCNNGEKSKTHSSPRQHLRRGHIRRLDSGNIWVNSCVVGDPSKGRIDKTYKVVK